MSYESVTPAAAHPGLAESSSIAIGPHQLQPDPLIVARRPRPPKGLPADDDETRRVFLARYIPAQVRDARPTRITDTYVPSDELEQPDRRVTRDRYVVDLDGHSAAVDVLLGPLAGLVLIEIECGSAAEREDFSPPACCGADVTHEDVVAGENLAGKRLDDLAQDLERFGYLPLGPL